ADGGKNGGHLAAFAAEHGIPTYPIEYPSAEPRSAFAHTFTPLLVFMQRLGYLPDQTLDFEVALTDPRSAVKRVRIAYEVPGENGRTEEVEFTLESEGLPSE
ncbi:MAG: hypothetical protein IIC35_08150, partial [Gemmatimonadetes bacterium]|nr:hypothetical protein [Gemmatimonadota bacterium]